MKQSYKQRFMSYVEGLNRFKNPDINHKQGSLLGEVFLWQEVHKYAKDRLKQAWEQAEQKIPLTDFPAGNHVACESPTFVLTLNVTKPRKTLDQEVLAENISKTFKVKLSVAEALIESARIPTTSAITRTVLERI